MLLRLRHQLDGELTRRLAAADRSGEAARLGGGSTAGWLRRRRADRPPSRLGAGTHRTRPVRPATGHRRCPVRGRHLPDPRPGTDPGRHPQRAELADQHYTGGMTQAETDLLHVAILANPRHPGPRRHQLAHTLDPQQALTDEQTRHAARALHVTRTLGGHIDIAGTGEAAGAEQSSPPSKPPPAPPAPATPAPQPNAATTPSSKSATRT